MDFAWVKPPKDLGRILMSGEVKTGDYQRFLKFMQAHVSSYSEKYFGRAIYLSSPGGNLVESLKIAGLLRQMYPTIHVENAQCASSCFFLYLSGAERYVTSNGSIGIHRAYFERDYFSGLGTDAARLQQARLSSLIETILKENEVPQSIREKMASTPSSDIYWLSDDEISSLGKYPAWYEELLIAKCDLASVRKQMKLDTEDFDPDKVAKVFMNFVECNENILAPEMKKLPALLASEAKRSN